MRAPLDRAYAAIFLAWFLRGREEPGDQVDTGFLKLLAWSHGCEYLCLAFQNMMAALINGLIIHTVRGIPCGVNTRDYGDRQDVGKRFLTFANASFVLIDEVSMI